MVVMSSKTAVGPAAFLPRCSGKTEVVEPVFVDPEVVGDLVQHRDPDLRLELGRVRKGLDERQAEDADPVRDGSGPVAALRQRDTS
jgi:hypothetical protein